MLVIAALWLMLFVSFILSQSREDQHCAAPVLWGLISPKIHTCVFSEWLLWSSSRCVQNNCLLLGELLPCPLNPCEAGMKGVALVFISPVNYWYLPLPWHLSGWRWKMSSHINEHIAPTCCLDRGWKKGEKLKCVNSLYLLFTTAVPRLTSTVFDLVSTLPLSSE